MNIICVINVTNNLRSFVLECDGLKFQFRHNLSFITQVISAHTRLHTRAYIHAPTYTRLHRRTCTRIREHPYTHMRTHKHVQSHTRVLTHKRTQVHAYTHIHTHTHAYTRAHIYSFCIAHYIYLVHINILRTYSHKYSVHTPYIHHT